MPRHVPIILFLGCALTFLNTPLRAQAPPIRAYTVAQGLAHNHVSRIYRDSQDFLWICTDEGLSRFDGRSFVNYTVANGLPTFMSMTSSRRERASIGWARTEAWYGFAQMPASGLL